MPCIDVGIFEGVLSRRLDSILTQNSRILEDSNGIIKITL